MDFSLADEEQALAAELTLRAQQLISSEDAMRILEERGVLETGLKLLLTDDEVRYCSLTNVDAAVIASSEYLVQAASADDTRSSR